MRQLVYFTMILLLPFGLLAAEAKLPSLAARQNVDEKRLAVNREDRVRQDREHAARLLAYLAKKFPDQITSVSADAGQIRIEGRLGADSRGVLLAEVPMWEDVTALRNSPETLLPIHATDQGRFVAGVSRAAGGGRDRLLSAWAVVAKAGDHYEPTSAMHYVDSEESRAKLPPARPRSRKGLGGCPFESPDMQELGIASVTLNIVLNEIISTQPASGRSPYDYAGRTWYIDDRIVAGYDRSMKTAAEHGWMVSAIILIAPVGNAPQGAWVRDAAHPDADPSGRFVMPNFTTRAGVDAYAAAMNFVAERYSRPDGKYGRVHSWIMHNEINSGFFWTTAGDKTMLTYLELYQKSMRLACLIARQYDPYAKPFISLDHCWTKLPDPRSYAARDLLERLVDFSRSEGDFPWGIAFHPYPQDIFSPRTWEDSEATFTFQTPFVTFKNLEVLDAWARQPRTAFQGRTPREIQLTEQGLNSRDYSEQAQAEQAAGLAYAWKKIEPLTTITAFQYHLWADERSEGGLRLGLRKFADDPQSPQGKKPIWRLFQAIGTREEEPASRFAMPIVGVRDWSEVHYTGEIKLAASGIVPPKGALRHSDVVFMYDDPAQYTAYGCTVLGWAGGTGAKHIEAAHAQGVRLFATSVGFLTESSRMIDFSPDFLDAACRNFEGRPFVVPWLWDFKHKGQSAWWWCTNSPLYRKYLAMRMAEVAKARPDGLHIDDYRGASGAVTWCSACFCRHCMAGFRQYLAKGMTKEKLASLGISDLRGFDYRQFLVERGVKPQDYQQRRASLPLAAEFLDFQVKANTAFVADYRRRAEELVGQPLSLCVNSGLDDAQALSIAPHLSYFCCEVNHAAASRTLPMHPVYVYKLADGLERPVAATSSGQDWAYVAENKLPGLVRTWIALSYAYGHNFMAPHHQWCYTKEKGTHWYGGPAEQYAWLYQFVRRSARLLDDYEALAPVAVVYDNAARRLGRGDIQPICAALAERNTPFTVVVAGDDWLDYRLDARRLDNFRAVIVTKDLAMDGEQRKLIEKVRSEGRLVVWPGQSRLDALLPACVQVEGTNEVLVVVRARSSDARAPLAIHLLNRGYDKATDSMKPLTEFRLRLRQDLFGKRQFSEARLHSPRAQPVPLKVQSEDGYTVIIVPALDLWAIVELTDRTP